jgi:hypothetical protein
LFQFCDDCAFVLQRGLCAGERGLVIIQHFCKARVAFCGVGALQIIFKFPQFALCNRQIAGFEFSPEKFAVAAHSCEILAARIVAIQTMFTFNLCPYV